MYPLIKETYFVDLTEPIKSFQSMIGKNPLVGEADQVIIAEDIFGAETLAVMMVKPFGDLYFTAVENHYAEAQIVAESMGKIMTMYAFDQYIKDYPDFTIRVVKNIQMKLDEINRLYESKREKIS